VRSVTNSRHPVAETGRNALQYFLTRRGKQIYFKLFISADRYDENIIRDFIHEIKISSELADWIK
jgi:hypothetical protein